MPRRTARESRIAEQPVDAAVMEPVATAAPETPSTSSPGGGPGVVSPSSRARLPINALQVELGPALRHEGQIVNRLAFGLYASLQGSSAYSQRCPTPRNMGC